MSKEYNLGDIIYYIDSDGSVRKDTITKKITTIIESSRRFDEPKKVEFIFGIGAARFSYQDIDNMLIFDSEEVAIKSAKKLLKSHIEIQERRLDQFKEILKAYD